MERGALRTVALLEITLLWLFARTVTVRGQSGPNQDNVIDLLAALNMTHPRSGVTRVQSSNSVMYKIRPRAPHLTLPQEYSHFLYSNLQGSIGVHVVGHQASGSNATVFSLSSASLPIFQIVSSTVSKTLRVDYQTGGRAQGLSSVQFPRRNPFSQEELVQLAVSLEADKLTFFVNCEEPAVLPITNSSLQLPQNVVITLASMPGKKETKFNGYLKKAEISLKAYQQRPWICDNGTDALSSSQGTEARSPDSQTDKSKDASFTKLQTDHRNKKEINHHVRDIQSDQHYRGLVFGSPGTPQGVKPSAQAQREDKMRKLEKRLEEMARMLDMVKAQNADLQSRVKHLEGCECVRGRCVWEGREMQEGQSWQTDVNTVCSCTSARVSCRPVFNKGASLQMGVPLPDPCLSNPCQNGSTCLAFTSDPGGFHCSCPSNHRGPVCHRQQRQTCSLSKPENNCEGVQSFHLRWAFNPTSGLCEDFLDCTGNGSNSFPSFNACRNQCMLGACCLSKPRQRYPSEPWHYSQFEYNITSVNRTLLGDDNLIMEDEVWYSNTGFPHKELQDMKESPKQTNCTADLDFTFTCDYLTHTQCQALVNRLPEQTQVVSFSPGMRCSDVACGGGCGCFSQRKVWRSNKTDRQGCEDCTCTESGKVDCVCRHLIQRKEIRDLTLRERRLYQRAIRKLYAQPAVWKEFALLRAEFAPQAGHHTFFLPWHRYFLRLVEHELQSVSSCKMAIPYFEWTVDPGSMKSSAAWQAGLFGGDGEPETGCVPHHPFQALTPHFYWKPCLRRSFNSSVWLPDAVTLHKTINQADFQVFSQSLQTFSGLFRLWVGGHMASPLAAYDPLYLSHIAFLDKLWEQWQEKHQPAPRRETSSYHQVAHQWHVKMKPFDVNFNDVIFSQQKACIVYVPITIGAPCNITSFQTHPQGNRKYQRHSINKSMSHDSGRFDQYGYDRDGYDRSGWDRWGFTKDGFNLDSIDKEGYDMSGFNRYGFNRSNVTWFGIHRNTVFEKKWMKQHDEEESDVKTLKDKTILETFRDNGYNIHGFDPFGLDRSGFDAFGFQADGYDKDGCNWFFDGPHYLRIYFHVQQQLLSSSDEVLAHIPRTCPPITSLPQHWGTWDWIAFVPGKCRKRNCQLDQNRVGPNTSESDNMAETENRSKIWLPVTPDHRFCFKLHWYSGCPLGSAPITCPDLCHDARCHGYPQAVCNMRNCGSCFIEWRDPATGNHLICHDWSEVSKLQQLQGCEPDGRVHNVSYTPAEDCRRQPDDCNRDCPPRPCPPINCIPAPPAPPVPNDCTPAPPAPPAPNDCTPAPPAPPAPNDCTPAPPVPPAPPAPNDCRRCTHGGVQYDNGAQWRSAGDPCDICYCTEGNVQCRREPCNTPCKNPAPPPSNLCCPVCQACSFNGRDYPNGAAIPTGDRCQQCHCVSGNVACSAIRCAALKCRNPVHHPGECCPRCDRCDYESQVYMNGQKFSSKTDPCIHCHCSEGEVFCDRRDSSCPPPKCSHPAKRKGECCPTCNECEYDRRVYADGKTFIPAGSGPCLQCRCKAGNVMCHEEKCPPVHCSNPVRDPHQCCPACRGCVSNGVEYHEGAKWQTEDACSSCTCVNGEVVCSRTRCPAQQCQHPTRNRASCCATCDSCTYNSRVYSNGQTFTTPDQPCQTCTCLHGTVSCERRPCPRLPCANAYTPPGECCAKCPVCRHAGREYRDGEEFPHPTDPCRSCNCLHGNVQCLMRRCPPLSCPNPVSVRGECCPQCPAPPSGCVYERRSYRHMERFQHPTDNCRVCNCHDGAVQCQRKPCPRASCSHPVAQECCQTCDACLYEGRQRANGETWEDASDRCSACVCREGSVQCERQHCPPANCKHPVQRHCCMSCEGCMHRGKEYPEGSEFRSDGDPCSVCHCRGGEVICSVMDCRTDCSHPYKAPGQCCGECERCFYNNALLYNGQSVADPRNPCTDCVCQSGSVRCLRKPCPQVRCPHPLTDQCGCSTCDGCLFQGVTYADGQRFRGGDKECQDCTCTRGEVVCTSRRCPDTSCNHPTRDRCSCNVCDGCNFERRECFNGERFPHPDDHCQLCSCSNGAVNCQRRTCPVQCTHPVPSNDCCPVCDSCQYEGSFYSHGQTFTSSSSPCQSCTCVRGTVTCLPLVCPPTDCLHPVVKPGQCCPECPVSECMLEGQEFRDGQTWPQTSNPCSTCICRTGEVQCSSPQCPKLTCMHQVMDPATCCPRCRGCMYGGEEYPEGSSWFADSTPCLTCMCVDGVTTCSEVQCLSPCVNHITVPGECCPMCADCIFEGKVYGPGESFHPANDPCQICTCEVMPDGEQHLRCYRKQCPSLVDCPKNHILFSGPDSCCPVCAQPLSNCTAALIGNEVPATDDPCFTCHCKDLTWTCLHQACPPLDCSRSEQFNSPDLCCPVCKDCVIEGQNKRVTNGTSWTDSADDCVKCTCILGSVECNIEECPPVVCLIGQKKVKIPGKCCHECQDSGASCLYQGTEYHSNEQWEVDQCTSCTCVSGEVHCHSERCPPLTCATDEMPAVVPGLCCPHCIPRPATCVAFGDPHYRTFDGRMLHFQGTCTYVFAQDCDGGDFSVQVTNEDRGRKGVSWTKEVTVLLGDITVQLLQDWIVKVNNEVVALPFLNEPFIYIERQTNTILLNTNIGLKVLWSLRSHLEVSVPGSYKDQTCGLCGNFNNYHQDDLRMPSGRISLSESEFGNSWRVTNGSHSVSACRPGEDVNPCKEAGYQTKKGANTRCKVLKSAVFRPCHRVVPPEPWYAACVYDLCACGANSDECLCDTLEAYASQCREAGVILQWRSASLCAVGCPVERGFVFDECGPPCPVTCFNVDVPLGVIESHCFKPCVPGCQCPAGLVLHNNYCIQPEKCPKIIHGKS